MGDWTIKTLYYGQMGSDRGDWFNGIDRGLIIQTPYLGYLLQNGRENVVVDSGINGANIIDGKGWGGFPAQGGARFILESLEKAGLTPKDISTVIYTHLHQDHGGNCDLFPDARTIIQKDEYANLLNPLPIQQVRSDYDVKVIQYLKKCDIYFVDGDLELDNGLKLIKLPGHTLGSQGIIVPTAKGNHVMTGDMPHKLYNLFPQMDTIINIDGTEQKVTPAPLEWGRAVPNSIVYDYYAFFDSMDKIRLIPPKFEPQYFLTGHDSTHLHTFPNN